VDDIEQEQIDEMKAWWAEYGNYVIAGVVIAVGLIIGFNLYKSNKLEAQIAASEMYETLAVHVTDGDVEDAESVAGQLASNYANTAYAAQSRLAMARLYMDNNRDQDAVEALRELLEMRGNGPLKHVGRSRLARILLYQEKPQEVLDLLEGQDNEAFVGLYAEARGDAYVALGQFAEADEAYRAALAAGGGTVNAGLVQMKLLDLPEIVTAFDEPLLDEGPVQAADEEAAEESTEEAAEEAASDEEAGDTE
jgi:predicted negative regulator of RcsB-dependent stress response